MNIFEISLNHPILISDAGGRHDPSMLSTIAELQVPVIMMHMRGTPQTMASKEFTEYQTGDCIAEIAAGELRNLLLNSYFLVRYLFKPHFQSISDFLQLLWHPHFFTIELNQQLSIANSIMPRWMQLVDPGIGFAKGANHKPAKSHDEQYA